MGLAISNHWQQHGVSITITINAANLWEKTCDLALLSLSHLRKWILHIKQCDNTL